MTTRPHRISRYARGYTTAFISAIVLSTTGILIRHLTQTYQLPSLILAFWRDGFVALTLLAVFGAFKPLLLRLDRHHWGYLAGYGLVLALFNATWTASVTLNGAAVATVLAYCSAGFTVILGWWLLEESLGWTKIFVVVLTLGGCVLVSGALDPADWQSNPVGILMGLSSGLGYALYTLLGRSASQRGLNPWATLLYTFGFATLFLLAFNLQSWIPFPGKAAVPGDLFWLGSTLAGWGILLLLAAGPTVIGFGLYNISLTYLPSGITNLIVTSEPVFTAIIAFFLLGERLDGVQLIGSALILAGVIFLRIKEN